MTSTIIEVSYRPSRTPSRGGRVVYSIGCGGRSCRVVSAVRLAPAQWRAYQALSARGEVPLSSESALRSVAADVARRFRYRRSDLSFADYMQRQIDRQRALRHYGTACNYKRALSSLLHFVGHEPLSLADVQPEVIDRYHLHLVARGVKRNSVSFYMRNLRAVYNKAAAEGLVVQSQPFAHVYTGVDRTAKRAVSEPVLRTLLKLPLAGRPSLAFARDLFIFSYCARGMAFVDMAYLQHSDLAGGFINYARKKTGRRLVVRIEPIMRTIIERYRRADSPYVFPIIRQGDAASAYHQYVAALNEHNRRLALLSMLLPQSCRLTSYVARHSWATAAQGHHVPVSTISAALGHSTEQTTRIYLAQIENAEIDSANRNILRSLLR